jgi:hypothetical protein
MMRNITAESVLDKSQQFNASETLRIFRASRFQVSFLEMKSLGLIFLIGVAVALGACTDGQVPPIERAAMYDSNPASVRKVQIALQNRGYYAGVVDGYLGETTGFAIQRFQIDHFQRVKPLVDRPLLVSLGIGSDY